MQKKHNALFLIMGLVSMVCAGYALFVTVFNQIISQNEGFFYAIVFGGILILLYIFINIVCKLLDVSDKMRTLGIFKTIYIVLVLALCVAFVFSRLSYKTTVPTTESTYYNAAILINNESLSTSGNITSKISANPSQYVLALIVSVILKFVPEGVNVAFGVNLFFCCVTALLVYGIASKFTDTFCAVIAVAVSLFSPGQLFSVYSYSSDCMLATIFFGNVFSLVCLIFSENKKKKIFWTVIYSVVSALLLLSEPTFIIFMVLTLLLVPITKRINYGYVVLATVLSVVFLAGLLFVKSYHLGYSFGEAIGSFLSCFVNNTDLNTGSIKNFADIKSSFESFIGSDDRHIENNYYYMTKSNGTTITALTAAWTVLLNQLLFMFVLVLCISSIFSAIQYKDLRFGSLFAMVISAFCTIFFASGREENTYFYHSILAILSSCGLFYIYLNHHPEEAKAFRDFLISDNDSNVFTLQQFEENEIDEEEKQRKQEEFMVRAKALIFADENVGLYNLIKNEEKSSAAERIRVNIENEAPRYESQEKNVFSVQNNNADVVNLNINNDIEDAEYEVLQENNEDIIGIGKNAIVEEKIEPDNSVTAVTYIPNPLPVPVRKPHVQLDYDIDVSDDDDWDLDITDDKLGDYDY